MLKEAQFFCAVEAKMLGIHGFEIPGSVGKLVPSGTVKYPKTGTYVRFSVDFLPAVWYNTYQYKKRIRGRKYWKYVLF